MAKNLFLALWKEYDIAPEKVLYWNIGTLQLWCKSVSNEIRIASKYVAEDQRQTKNPEESEWSRFTIKQNFSQIHLTPVFPDRPVVVQTESPFKLTRSASAKVYIRVPIWIKIELMDASKNFSLLELPSVILSNTWFGDFFEGELCYWISTGARREFLKDLSRPYLSICPIEFINKSDEDLSVEKICLRVAGLSLFHDGEQLWSDETKVIYKGKEKGSQIINTGRAPNDATSAKLISSPRESDKKTFAAKTFSSLKELSGFGNITS